MILNFLKKPVLLKNRKYLILGIITSILFIIAMIMMILDAATVWIIILLTVMIVPGIWFQIQEYKLSENYGIKQLIPLVLMIAFIVIVLVKVL